MTNIKKVKWMMKRIKLAVLLALLLAVGSLQLEGQLQKAELIGLVDKIVAQLDLAVQHAILGAFSATLPDVKAKAHQVLNLSIGRGGPGYDPTFGDPGDGVGLLNYVRQLFEQTQNLPQAQPYRLTVDNVLLFVNFAVEHTRKALRTPRGDEARLELRQAQAFFSAARGSKEDLPSEGGARTLQALLRR